MMLSLLLFGLLGIGASLAIGAMIATWREYAQAWAALDAQRAQCPPVMVRYMTIRVVSTESNRSLIPAAAVRTRLPFDRHRHGLRAAA